MTKPPEQILWEILLCGNQKGTISCTDSNMLKFLCIAIEKNQNQRGFIKSSDWPITLCNSLFE